MFSKNLLRKTTCGENQKNFVISVNLTSSVMYNLINQFLLSLSLAYANE